MAVINSLYDDKIYTKDHLNIYMLTAAPLFLFVLFTLLSSIIYLSSPLHAQVATGPPGAVNVVGSNPL